MVHFETLLQKYMQHLFEMEDSLFLELINGPFSAQVEFTVEELQVLRRIETRLTQVHIR